MIKNRLQWRWLTFAVRGVLAVVFGALVLFVPARAAVPLVTVFAIYVIADGLVLLALARSQKPIAYVLLRSLVSVGAGVIALLLPPPSFGGLIILLAMWAGAAGLLELAVVFRMQGSARSSALVVLHAALTIAFGLAIMISPITGSVLTAVWLAAYAIVFGALLEAAAVRLRTVARNERRFAAA